MIKVFTTGQDPANAGDALTEMFVEWQKEFVRGINIISVHTNSNKYGWMLTVTYRPL